MKRWLVMAAVAATTAVVGAQGRDRAMASLVQAERAFAKMSVDTTQREAFLANFADDGVWFDPGPSNTKAALRTPPPTATAAQAVVRTLDWEPVHGDVSASGDLGYTTGPWVRSVRGADTPPTTGWFFSVWKRQGTGPWRVAADFGIPAPSADGLRSHAFRQAEVPPVVPAARPDRNAVLEQLRAADRTFAEAASQYGAARAYGSQATEDVRVYRPGRPPVVGRSDVASFVSSASARLAWQPSYVYASAAGDLGFTYGAYSSSTADGGTGPHGYYLHVWKRRPDGWRLAADIVNIQE